MQFRQEVFDYLPLRPAANGWVILTGPEGENTNASLNAAPDMLQGRNWLHFDLYTSDQSGEIERPVELGAKRHLQEYDGDEDFAVLENPDGNLFCVVDIRGRRLGFLNLARCCLVRLLLFRIGDLSVDRKVPDLEH